MVLTGLLLLCGVWGSPADPPSLACAGGYTTAYLRAPLRGVPFLRAGSEIVEAHVSRTGPCAPQRPEEIRLLWFEGLDGAVNHGTLPLTGTIIGSPDDLVGRVHIADGSQALLYARLWTCPMVRPLLPGEWGQWCEIVCSSQVDEQFVFWRTHWLDRWVAEAKAADEIASYVGDDPNHHADTVRTRLASVLARDERLSLLQAVDTTQAERHCGVLTEEEFSALGLAPPAVTTDGGVFHIRRWVFRERLEPVTPTHVFPTVLPGDPVTMCLVHEIITPDGDLDRAVIRTAPVPPDMNIRFVTWIPWH
jgi:hypothetical protein